MIRPLPRRPNVPARYGQGSERPVVILPGVYETWRFLRPIADEVAALDLHGVALVAHSKGGLIGKHLLAYDDPDGRLDRLVAVATPFGGSRLARYAVGSTLRAFLPGDPVIRSLAAERAVNSRITSIYPRIDPNIPEGSRLEGATNVEIPIWGHFRILTSSAALAAVVSAVEV